MDRKSERQIGFVEAFILLVAIIGIIFFNAMVLKIGTGLSVLSVAMVIGVYSMLILRIPWDESLEEILKVFQVGMGAVLILMMVGIIGASWTVSGTTPMLIYYGLELISPGVFLVVAFLLCCLLGIATGSAWAIIGSVGLALMGVGKGLGIPVAPAAAAIAMGSYIGDMWSPFSDVPNLNAASTTGTSFDVFKAMIPTMVPALLISVIVYGVLGAGYSTGDSFDKTAVLEIQAALSGVYNWNILLLLPPLIVIVGAVLKYPTIPVLTLSGLVAVLEGVIFQGKEFAASFNTLYVGTVSETGNEAIDALLTGGGLLNMMSLILIIFCAFIFAGILERSGIIKVLLGNLSQKVRNRGVIVAASLFTSILSVYLTASVYVATIINARIWNDVYLDNDMSGLNLAKTMAGGMSNWGMIVPWSGGVAVMINTFGVDWYEYAPYLITTWAVIVLTLIYGFTNRFILAPTELEKEKLQEKKNQEA